VFGEGPRSARLFFVGEQPGDREDLVGRPFVGPAGLLFDRALADAGIDRHLTYVTNAVKHFKFEPRGKRRIHRKPAAGEIEACRWWLVRELELVDPELVVALGATAIRALSGRSLPVIANRGRFVDGPGGRGVFVTVHPSSLLRSPDEESRKRDYARFVADLASVGKRLAA
jgi:DNA polymerase